MGTVNRLARDLERIYTQKRPPFRACVQLMLCAVLLWGALPQPTAHAAEPPLRVLLNDVAPYTIHADAGYGGLHHQILAALLTETGLAALVSVSPYGRLAETLQQGRTDLAVGLSTTPWNDDITAVGEFHLVQYQLLPHVTAGISSMETLKGKMVGVARGAYYDPRINGDDSVITFPLTDPFQGVRMLSHRRLDAVASSNYLLAHALRQKGLDTRSFAAPITFYTGAYVLYATDTVTAETRDALRDGLDRLHRKGVIRTLTRLYQ